MTKTMGRPQINRKQIVHYLCEAFRLDATVEVACSYARISKSSFYNFCNEDEDFLDEIKRARAYTYLVAKGAVVGAMELGDAKIALRYLQLRDNRYKY